jgi:hypothetical protein
MECVLFLIVLLAILPLLSMLLGRGPNNLRRLLRLDLAAFFVLTAGIALAFGVTRAIAWDDGRAVAALILVLVLPMTLATAWFARFVIEELWSLFRKK